MEDTQNIGGSWSALTYAGEATNLNLAHVEGVDCTDVNDLTRAERLPILDQLAYNCGTSSVIREIICDRSTPRLAPGLSIWTDGSS